MNLSRHTCEAVFLDYYERRLNPVEVAELLFFLEENPDLKYLFENYNGIETLQDNIHFADKQLLKKKYLPEEIDQILHSEIDKSNCSYFFVAHAEGVLSAEQIQPMQAFLENHPEYKKEHELILACKISDTNTTFDKKEQLKKSSITETNKEDYFVRSVEKELSQAEQQQLNVFLLQNPKHQTEYDLFAKTKLPIEKILFQEKESLKKRRRKPVLIPLFYQKVFYYSAAASLLFLVGIFFLSRDITKPLYHPVSADNTAKIITPSIADAIQHHQKENDLQVMETPVSPPKQLATTMTLKKQSAFKRNEYDFATTLDVSNTDGQKGWSCKPIQNRYKIKQEVDKKESDSRSLTTSDTTSIGKDVMEQEKKLLAKEDCITPTEKAEELCSDNSNDTVIKITSSALAFQNEYESIPVFAKKKIKRVLGIKKSAPCDSDDKITFWDFIVAAKNGIQNLTGIKAMDATKICNGEEGTVEYIFTAGNFKISKSEIK
jgi:hypothetical protein